VLKGAQYHPAVMTVWRLGQLDIPYMGAAGAHAARQGRAGCQLAPQRFAHGIAGKPGVPFKGAVCRPTFVSPRLPAGDQLRDYDEIDRLAAVHGCHSDHVTKREMPALNSVPAEAISQQGQLCGVLHKLGATAVTPVTILSDGAGGPRALGEAASPGPTHHVLDWFHLSMRIHHVDQAAKCWPVVSADDRQTGADLVEIIDRIRWRLWHGQVARALDLIGETLVTLDGVTNSKELAAVAARKVARLLRDLETYICGQSDIIIDYATARQEDEPISTAVTESTVQWLLHRRMNAQQHMRWSPRGAHLMLKVRTATANGTLERDHAVAERWARRPYRRAA
jgi:hypothetical protein